MKMSIVLYSLLFFFTLIGFTPGGVGKFDANIDIGKPKLSGSSKFDSKKKEYILKGSGYNIWFDRDEFQYLYKETKGDFTATADFELIGAGKDPHRKVGWMMRESLDDDASHISAVIHGDGLTVMQWRVAKGQNMRDPEDEIFSKEKMPYTVQLQRKGNEYTMRIAPKGGKLQIVGVHIMRNMPRTALLGLYVCAHNPDVLEEARAHHVKITTP